jgi:flagellar basal body L-ring protein FlgH
MADKVEEYQDEHNLTDAEAIRRLVAAGINQQNQPTREEIAADLEEIQSAVRGVRREITDDDNDRDGGGQRQRAHQVGTVIAAVVTGVLASLVVLILGVPL